MGIRRWGDSSREWILEKKDDGHFVFFTDHERVVAELTTLADGLSNALQDASLELVRLRAELAAKSKQLDAVRDEMSNWGGPSSYLHSCCNEAVRELLGELNAAMGEGNGR